MSLVRLFQPARRYQSIFDPFLVVHDHFPAAVRVFGLLVDWRPFHRNTSKSLQVNKMKINWY